MLTFRLPRPDEEEEFLRAHRATTPEVANFLHGYEEGMPFACYLERLEERRRGENLPPGYVPSTFLFAFDGDRIVGRLSIRHTLNEPLLRVGGHIGYTVVPEFRRRGYATAMLRYALERARGELGLSRVLLTCDDDNVGSIRVIEKNGGVLEDVVSGPDLGRPKRRYWIDLGSGHRTQARDVMDAVVAEGCCGTHMEAPTRLVLWCRDVRFQTLPLPSIGEALRGRLPRAARRR